MDSILLSLISFSFVCNQCNIVPLYIYACIGVHGVSLYHYPLYFIYI
nr:MAG TPA: hypothetical protein [Caudoviricetes sp.]